MAVKFERPPHGGVSAKTIFRFAVRLRSGPVTEAFLARNPEAPERIIDIQGSQTLEDLHLAIFEAFDREEEHMYEFQIGGKKPMDRKAVRYGLRMDDLFDAEGRKDAADTPIASLGLRTGRLFFYWFDFGDDWWHGLRLLAVNPPEKSAGRYPRLVEKKGESPPQYANWEEEEAEAGDSSASGSPTGAALPPEDAASLPGKSRLAEITGLLTDFCESRLTSGYSTVSAQLFAAVRTTRLPWQRGKAQSWAAGLVHAAGTINFLHDPASEPYMKLCDIAPYFGVSPATMENKSREIRNALNIFPLDPRFCLPERLADSPLLWIRLVQGVLVDFRLQPREVQEEALKAGLIPFIPDDPPKDQATQKKQGTETPKEGQPTGSRKTDQYSLLE